MKALVAGSPLESLVWQREIGKVKIKFRKGLDTKDKLKFLNDLSSSIIGEITTLDFQLCEEQEIKDKI